MSRQQYIRFDIVWMAQTLVDAKKLGHPRYDEFVERYMAVKNQTREQVEDLIFRLSRTNPFAGGPFNA